MPVLELMMEKIPNTLLLIALSLIPVTFGSVWGHFKQISWDPLLVFIGVLPVVALALLAAAIVEINFAGAGEEGLGYWSRMMAAALTLGIADGALSGSILGNRALFEQENQQRYVGISILRGKQLCQYLPNLAGALVGQYRTRVVQLLSGAVIVEVIVKVDGFGALLWRGTLMQDFGVVLAAATVLQ